MSQHQPSPNDSLPKSGRLSPAQIALIVIAGTVGLFVIAVASYKPQTGAEIANKIWTACQTEYGSDQQAVADCEIKHASKALEDIQGDRDKRVSEAIGH